MLRQTPPLDATEAFLVAARTPSFRAAAAEMALSPSAFSRRIQLLESFLGAPLFDRSGAHAELTQTGRRYLDAIRPAVEAIRRASADIRAPSRDILRIATSHSLAVEWLVPRLGKALSDLGIGIELSIKRNRQALRDQEVDLAIWGAMEPDAGDGELLATLDAVPVSADRLADGRMPPRSIADLVTYATLGVGSPADFWRQWLYSVGYEGDVPEIGAIYETNQLCYEAAASGLGIALAVPLLANRYLEDRRLRVCAGAPAPTGMAYWIHYANPSVRRSRQIGIFIDWLKAEAAETKQRFMTLVATDQPTLCPTTHAPYPPGG